MAEHLPDQQNVLFEDGSELQALEEADGEFTTLTAFFRLNQEFSTETHIDAAELDLRSLYYYEIPLYFPFEPQSLPVPHKALTSTPSSTSEGIYTTTLDLNRPADVRPRAALSAGMKKAGVGLKIMLPRMVQKQVQYINPENSLPIRNTNLT